MRSVKRTAILAKSLEAAFFMSKVLGIVQITYNEREERFEQSNFLSKYSRLIRILWCFTSLPIAYYFSLAATPLSEHNEKQQNSELQRRCVCVLNAIQTWCAVTAVCWISARSCTSLLNILNAIIKCNRNLTKLLKIDALSSHRFHTFTVIRIIASVVDVYLIYGRPIEFYILFLEFESLIVCHRLVLMAMFFEWHFIQSHLTAAVDALNELLENEGYNLGPRGYHKLSRLYTQLFHLQRATCKYYQPFALATCAGLFRTVVMALHTFQALFLTDLKTRPLESTVYTFKVFMIPGLMTALDFVMICIMAENLSKSTESYRWTFLMQSLQNRGNESSQRTIETILRQSCWETLHWVLFTGHSISRSTCFVLLDATVSLTFAFLIYDGGYSVLGTHLRNFQVPLHRWQYYMIVVLASIGSLGCNRIVAWCMSSQSHTA